MAKQLSVAKRCGVYQLNREPYEVEREARAAGLAVFRVDIAHAHHKEDFIAQVGAAMKFPEWAGKNWDALNDCLTDLDWVKAAGYVLILEKAKHFGSTHKTEFDTAIAVMQAVADYWKDEGTPFWALVHGAQGWDAGLPRWPV